MAMRSRHLNPAAKKVFFFTHGETEQCSSSFDPRLSATARDRFHATLLQDVSLVSAGIEICVTSPLSCALDSASILFSSGSPMTCPIVALPMISASVKSSADIGDSIANLSRLYPQVDFSECGSQQPWFFSPMNADVEACRQQYPHSPWQEPEHLFKGRMEQFWSWLETRREKTVAVVTHLDVVAQLTGDDELELGKVRMISWKGFRVRPQA